MVIITFLLKYQLVDDNDSYILSVFNMIRMTAHIYSDIMIIIWQSDIVSTLG